MRVATYAALIFLAIASAATGNVALALALGGAKAVLVGAEFMELRHAARAHGLGLAAVIVALVLVLVVLTAA